MAVIDVQQHASSTQASASGPAQRAVADVYLGRQPILDRSGAVVGYELLFRRDRANAVMVTDADQASAQVIEYALGGFSIDGMLNGHPGFINFGVGLLMSEMLEALPADRFVLEILEDVEFDDAVIARCRALHAVGYRLALDDVTPDRPVPDEVLGVIDIVKIDLACTPAPQLAALIARFKRAGKTVLAEKVETREDFERTAMLGCELFQGYFFAHPEVLASRKARGSRAPLLRLLTVLSGESGLAELEDALKANPDIAIRVLQLASAAGYSACGPVSTLGKAIARVGTTRLARWVQLVMYAQGSGVPLRDNPLVQLVGTRARFMELAAPLIATGSCEANNLASSASLVGMLSLADVVLQIGCTELLEQLHLGPAIRAAIERREGPLGRLLACVEAMERQDEQALDECARRWPALDRSTISELGISAAQWVAQQCG